MDIDLIGGHYEALMQWQPPEKIVYITRAGQYEYTLKAFNATGEHEIVDGLHYYTQVKDTLVVDLSYYLAGKLGDRVRQSFTLYAHRDGGYVMDYPTRYRTADIEPEHFQQFSSLMNQLKLRTLT